MNKQAKWSLQQEIQKRAINDTLRAIESRQVLHPSASIARASAPVTWQPRVLPKPAPQATPARKRASSTASVPVHRARWTNRQKQISAAATALFLITCLVVGLSINRSTAIQPVFPPLPVESASNVVSYLKQTGIEVAELRTFSVPNEMWAAKQEFQFGVRNSSGVLVLLSYESSAQAGIDAFRATYHQKFKQWHLIQVSNVLLLSSPNTAHSLSNTVASHLSQYLIAPHRSFIPTATPRR